MPPEHSVDQSPAMEELSLTRVLAALSGPLRLGIVQLLSDGQERLWGEIDAPVSKSTLSHHMKTLRNAGITSTRNERIRCYVHLHSDDLEAQFPGLLPSLLAAAPGDATRVGLK